MSGKIFPNNNKINLNPDLIISLEFCLRVIKFFFCFCKKKRRCEVKTDNYRHFSYRRTLALDLS